ncbi:hypothetical protein C6A85_16335, partial [Mycobacterium sp. ITM-2017-0098]
VDLALLTLTNPDVVHRVLATVFEQIADGALPVPETTHYRLSDPVVDGPQCDHQPTLPSTSRSSASTDVRCSAIARTVVISVV